MKYLLNINWFWLFFLSLLLLGCQQGKNKEESKINKYFDLPALVNKELSYYQKHPPSRITKWVYFKEEQEMQQQEPEDLETLKKIINSIDINKPAFLNSYTIEKKTISEPDMPGKIAVVNRLKEGEKGKIKYIKAFYNGKVQRENLLAVKALKRTDNFLYSFRQEIWLSLEDQHLKNVIFSGRQKILFFNYRKFKFRFQIR